ncbi:Mov34-domain-containing protein [Hesseltinella vesiculosa]|uniref:COP9 signalosome complex subunit 6 n=1 Tax=Hesseltinella vesiculosa TaxID=101127 RepID=A0A1X2GP00_9FUNG|nr:Mov34-domain-containing protein [Hesseltinella vesiculosa]
MSDMDTSDDNTPVAPIVTSVASTSGLTISIHPLVLLNVSDHYTRTKLQTSQSTGIYGVLLAQQSGRDIDIIHSFELKLNQDNMTFDQEYLGTKLDQLKQVFPHLDFMGWYTVGEAPTSMDLELHNQILHRNESSLFLQLHPQALQEQSPSLPVGLYETIYEVHEDSPRLVFVKTPYKIETNDAERIAVDHVAKPDMSSADTSLSSTLLSSLTTQKNALSMLHSRLVFLQQYLQDTKNGTVPMDHDILRQISSVCQRTPVTDHAAFDDQFSRVMLLRKDRHESDITFIVHYDVDG